MDSERKDQWSIDDDNILAETVLHHIKTGSTQLKAFEEAGKLLKRTPAACGFRWNSEVRKHRDNEIKAAKQQRKMNLNIEKNQDLIKDINENKPSTENKYDPYTEMIEIVKEQITSLQHLISKIDNLKEENEMLKGEIQELKQMEPNTFNEDYNNLIEILKRARELGILDNVKQSS